jgi:hypothetical protein
MDHCDCFFPCAEIRSRKGRATDGAYQEAQAGNQPGGEGVRPDPARSKNWDSISGNQPRRNERSQKVP